MVKKKINKDAQKIRSLEIELNDEKRRNGWLERERNEFKEDLKKSQDALAAHEGRLDGELRATREEIVTLREIIRWQINPGTTKHPFDSSLDQKDERAMNQGSRYQQKNYPPGMF